CRLEWQLHRVGPMRRLLGLCRPRPGEADLRGWEWHYLDGLAHADLLTLPAEVLVNGVAFTPDGRRLVAGMGNPYHPPDAPFPGSVRVWDLTSVADRPDPPLRWAAAGHRHLVTCIAVSPDGRLIASGSRDHTVRLWDADTGKLVRTLEGHASWVEQVAFAGVGGLVASADFVG